MKKSKPRQLIIPKKGGKLGGVSVALANYFNVDVTLVRVVWVLLALPGGLPGLIPYATMWFLIPNE